MDVHLKVIETEEGYERALADFERLFDAAGGSPDADIRDVLAVLIRRYEDERFPIDLPSPAAAIRFRMEQAGLTQKDLVPYIGVKSKVSEVLSGKRELSMAMIRALNKGLGIPADVLIREPLEPLPAALSEMDYSRFPLVEMEKNGAFQGFAKGDSGIKERAEEAVRWLVGAAGGAAAIPSIGFRKTDGMRVRAALDRYALLGWSLQALKEAKELPALERFNPAIMGDAFIKALVSLSVLDDGPRHARDYLAKAGLVLLALPHLKHTYLDGAVFIISKKTPVIALTLRYDRLDNFWFVLLHELGHVARGHLSGDSPWIADDLDLAADGAAREEEADDYAARSLLPEDFSLSAREDLKPRDVVDYARRIGVHPAIVAGRIQHERNDFRSFANQLGRGEVRKCFSRYGRTWISSTGKE
ncbi:MAG: ImmA/IrrE family metallo-endopeptidase [Rectinemataceae bacterium]|jgi:HTH-type transcriptional regulator/antitoxin HigA